MAKEKLNDVDTTGELWDDEEFNFDPDMDSVRDDRSPSIKLASTAGRAVRDTVLSRSFANKLLREGLPEEYGKTMDNVDNALWEVNKIKDNVIKKARPAIIAAKQTARTLNRMIPNPLQDKIERALAKQSGTQSSVTPDVEGMAVEAGLAGVFQDVNDKQDEKVEKLADKITENDFRQKLFETLGKINYGVQRDYAYKTQVTRRFQQKQLELQIRQLVVTRNLLEVTTKSSTENAVMLKAIMKNTGLPDIMKEQNSESFKRLAREKIIGKAQEHIGGYGRRYLGKVGKNVDAWMTDRIDKFMMGLQGTKDAVEALESTANMSEEMGLSKRDFFTELIAGQGTMALGNKLGKAFRKWNPMGGKLKNAFSRTKYITDNLGYKLNDWAEKNQEFGTLKGTAAQLLNVRESQGGKVYSGGNRIVSEELDREDRKLRSLEVILPGLLSRLIQVNTEGFTGKKADRIVFDENTGRFSTYKESLNTVRDAVMRRDEVQSSNDEVMKLVNTLDSKTNLSAKDRTALFNHLSKMTRTNKAFSPENIIGKSIPGMSKAGEMKLKRNVESRYGIKEVKGEDNRSKWAKTKDYLMAENGENIGNDAEVFNRARNMGTQIYNRVHGIAQTGQLEQLIELGVVKKSGDDWILDEDYQTRFNEGIRGEDELKEREDAMRRAESYRLKRKKGKGKKGKRGKPADIMGRITSMADLFARNTNPDIPPETKMSDILGRNSLENGDSVKSAIELQTEQILAAMKEREGGDELRQIIEQIALVNEQIAAGITYIPGEGSRIIDRKGLFSRIGSGLKFGGKKMWGLGKSTALAPWKAAKGFYRAGRWMARKPLRALKNKIFGAKDKVNIWLSDAYVKGVDGLRHALTAAGLIAGRYKDVETGRIIKSLKDITGAVIDLETGKIVITAEEFKNGLFNSFGEKIKVKGIINAVKNAGTNLFKLATSPVTFAKNTAKSLYRGVTNFILSPPDIYVGGEDKPRLYSTQFKSGMYYSGMTGKPLRYFGDIDGDVVIFDSVTRERTVVLTAKEIQEKGLYDSKGKPIRGMLAKIKDAIMGLGGKLKTAASFLNPFKTLKWAKDKAGKVWNGAKNIVGGLGAKVPTGQTHWLRKIYKLLVTQFTGGEILGHDDDGNETQSKSRWSKLRESIRRKMGTQDERETKFKSLKEKMDARKQRIQNKIEEFEVTEKARGIWEKKKKAVGDRASDIKDRLLGREGSWMNRMSKKIGGSAMVKGAVENVKKHGLWKGLILNAILGIPAMLGLAWKKITSSIFGLKDIIKNGFTWFMRKKAIDQVGDAISGGDGGFDGDYDRRDRRRNRNRQGRGNNRNRGRGGTRRPTPRIRPSNRPPTPRPGGMGGGKRGIFRSIGNGIRNVGSRIGGFFSGGGGRAAASGGRRGLVRAGLRGLASGVGRRLLVQGGLAVGRMALAMTGPVGWGIMAGAAAIYGAYKLYKYIKNTADDFQTLRMLTYGFDVSDKSINEKILNVEGIVNKVATYRDGKVNIGTIDFKSIVDCMEIDMAQVAKRNAFARWFDQRFMPAFTASFKAAKELVPGSDVTDIEKSIPNHFKGEWATKTRIPGDGSNGVPHPYFFSVSPFGEGNLITGTNLIDKAIAVIVNKYAKDAKVFEKNEQELDDKYQKLAAKIGGPVYNPHARKSDSAEEQRLQTFVTPSERDATIGSVSGSPAEKSAWAQDMTIDDILAIRMRIYGLPVLNATQVRVIMELEKEVIKHVTYASNGAATMNKSANDMYRIVGVRFGVGTDAKNKSAWMIWYGGRFIQTFLNYLAQVRLENPGINPLNAWKFLKAEALLRVVDMMSKAVWKDPKTGEETSVWKVPFLPFPGVVANTDETVIRGSIERLKAAVKDEELKEKTRGMPNKPGANNPQRQKVANTASLFKNLLQEKGWAQNDYSKSTQLDGPGTSMDNAGMHTIKGAPKGTMKLSGSAEQYANALLDYAKANGIEGEELAMFMGQLAEETGDFTHMTELGNSAYFEKYEKGNLAKQLGNTQRGDGERFKGRGWMQITGRALYEMFSKLLGIDFVNNPELMADPKIANYTAVWYWKKYALPLIKRKGLPTNILTTSAAINGWYEDKSNPGWPRKAINYDVRVEKIRQWAQRLGLTEGEGLSEATPNTPTNQNTETTPNGGMMETSADESPGGGVRNTPNANTPSAPMQTPSMGNPSPTTSRPNSAVNPLSPNRPASGPADPSLSPYQAGMGMTQVDRNFQKTKNAMNMASNANGSTTEDYKGLKVKPDVATDGGPVVPGLIRLAQEIQIRVEDFWRFTALNDGFHQRLPYDSSHKRGLALDFTLYSTIAKDTIAAFRTVLNIMSIAGMETPTVIKHGGHWMGSSDFIIINEYLKPSGSATGGHIHVNFCTPQSANKFLKAMGPNAGSVGDEDDQMSSPPTQSPTDAAVEATTTPPISTTNTERTPTVPDNSPNVLTPEQQQRVTQQEQQKTITQAQREQREQQAREQASKAASNQVAVPNEVNEMNREMLKVQRDMLDVMKEIRDGLVGKSNTGRNMPPIDQKGNSYASQGTNSASPLPVNLKVG